MTRGPYLLALVVAALAAIAAVTYVINDPDLWQHLVVGRVIWQTHAIPHTQLWTWPTHGAPDVLPSWLFRALLWPVWQAAGVHGLFLWRWVTTLVAFGLMLAAARRAGATGVVPLVMLAWCVLFWRQRSQVRPETFAGMLLAAETFVLEARRQAAARGEATRLHWWLPALALVWANAHISYYLGFVVSGGYLLDDLVHRQDGRRPRALALAIAVAAAASFANPFGIHALLQPLDYFTVWRHEPVYQSIGELSPIYWDVHVRDLLPLWLAIVVLAALVRWRRHGFDAAECVLLVFCLPQAVTTQRFLGYAALALAPFAARDVGSAVAAIRWPAPLQPPLRRAALAAVATLALVTPTLAAPFQGFGYGLGHMAYPVRACDWIAQQGVRGHAFNVFSFGGYMLWRFYPDPGRLPFMDIHQAGTKEIRYLYAYALQDSNAWHELDKRFHCDYVLLPRSLPGDPDLADFLDQDRAHWALVFCDDDAALWLRRDGSAGAIAERQAFRYLPGGARATGPLGLAVYRDSTLRGPVRAELQRAIESSPWNARAHLLAGNLDMLEGHFPQARTHYAAAVRLQPYEPVVHERLGLAQYYSGDPRSALASYKVERHLRHNWPEADLREAQALAALGETGAAKQAYKRSMQRHPELVEARDSLEGGNVRRPAR